MNHRERVWVETWSEWSGRLLMAAAMGAMILAARSVLAGEPVVWNCWLEARTYYVYCDATRPLPPAQVAALGDVSGFLLADGEPVETVPASLVKPGMPETANAQWRFPLYTIPRDPERVQMLAQTLLCGRSSDCQVLFSATR